MYRNTDQLANADHIGHRLLAKVIIKCPLTYISVPIIDKKSISVPGVPRSATRKAVSRIWSVGKRRKKKAAIAKKKKPVLKIIYQAWPVINPAQLFRRLVQADRRLLCSDDFSWQAFWEKARTEDWALNHPVLNLPSKEQGMAMACSFHGDEGQTKRQKNCMVLSWSSIAVSGKSELTKFPYCVSWLHDVPRVS